MVLCSVSPVHLLPHTYYSLSNYEPRVLPKVFQTQEGSVIAVGEEHNFAYIPLITGSYRGDSQHDVVLIPVHLQYALEIPTEAGKIEIFSCTFCCILPFSHTYTQHADILQQRVFTALLLIAI